MRPKIIGDTDVVVVGSGIAGVVAAIEAASLGAKVTLISKGKLFSGSSFYPGTWGLGLIAPTDDVDEDNLKNTILSVGQQMADETLVDTFVRGIRPSIEYIKEMGIKLKTSHNQTQKDFIPCFDYKHRDWNGILFESAKEVFERKLKELGVEVISRCELIDLVTSEKTIAGAVIKSTLKDEIERINCKALIMATGGLSSLFEEHITTSDVMATGHYLALKSGCELVNIEFMQIMPAYVKPCYKTIFNEKAFRFVDLLSEEGEDLLDKQHISREIMEKRSTHGPFTSELESREIDFLISKTCHEQGIKVKYRPEIKDDMSEFVKTYFDWLKENKNLTVDDEIYIKMFAHASNGGIKIKNDTSTGVKGLFACGEVTGGMHGADRIGGLSTANGLVFGRKAGKAAFEYSRQTQEAKLCDYELDAFEIPHGAEFEQELSRIMFRYGMVIRNEEGLNEALNQIKKLEDLIQKVPSQNHSAICQGHSFLARLNLAKCVLNVQLLRAESRGSHFREDFPHQNQNMNRRIIVRKDQTKDQITFE